MTKTLELYVHIPFCVKKCSYCDFLSFPVDEATQDKYTQALLKEIAYYGAKMKDCSISTIFIGGGTPSWLDESNMLQILDAIHKNFEVSRDAEITMECNPGTLTMQKLVSYRNAGVNRLSIGLQSADDEELKILGRIHTFNQFLKTYEMAREAGFTNINVDLISGIPYQTAEKFLKTLKTVVRLKPNHISAYTLIVEEGTPFYEEYRADVNRQKHGMPTSFLPDEDETYRIYKLTQQYMLERGYEQYEISNFAQMGCECKHNIGYWTRDNYLGVGLGAASLIDNVRYSNTRDLHEYINIVMGNNKVNDRNTLPVNNEGCEGDIVSYDSSYVGIMDKKFSQEDGAVAIGTNLHEAVEKVSRKAQMEEYMFLGLRMKQGVTREGFEKEFGIPVEGVYSEVIEHLRAEGLLEMSEGRIYLTDKGMDLGTYSMSQFLL